MNSTYDQTCSEILSRWWPTIVMVIGPSWVLENAFQHAVTKQMVTCPLGAANHCVLLECVESLEKNSTWKRYPTIGEIANNDVLFRVLTWHRCHVVMRLETTTNSTGKSKWHSRNLDPISYGKVIIQSGQQSEANLIQTPYNFHSRHCHLRNLHLGDEVLVEEHPL